MFVILFTMYNRRPFDSIVYVQMQRRKCLFLKLKVKRVNGAGEVEYRKVCAPSTVTYFGAVRFSSEILGWIMKQASK